jgi:hypothetical protein
VVVPRRRLKLGRWRPLARCPLLDRLRPLAQQPHLAPEVVAVLEDLLAQQA